MLLSSDFDTTLIYLTLFIEFYSLSKTGLLPKQSPRSCTYGYSKNSHGFSFPIGIFYPLDNPGLRLPLPILPLPLANCCMEIDI